MINKLRAEEKHTFPMVMNKQGGPDVSALFGVQAYPTNYLIGSDGKILARFVGFDESALLAELKKAGFKP